MTPDASAPNASGLLEAEMSTIPAAEDDYVDGNALPQA